MITPTTLELALLTERVRHCVTASEPDTPVRVGKFRVVHQVGAGGSGDVYEALDEELERRVAIKILRSSAGTGDLERIRHEARAMARVDHENVARVFEIGTWRGRLCVAMQLVQGSTLREWANKPRSFEETLRVLVGVGRGLAAIHDAGLIHLDVKPENVLVDARGVPKLVDFGLAQLMDVTVPTVVHNDGSAAPSGRLPVGTPGYIAPEVASGGRPGEHADQYSLACVMHEFVYASSLRTSASGTCATPMSSWRSLVRRGHPRGRVPSRTRRAIERALSFDPAKRWPSVEAFIDEVDRPVLAPASRRTMYVLGATVLGVLVLASPLQTARRQAQCHAAREGLDDAVGDAVLTAIEASFEATGVSHARPTWLRTSTRLRQAKQEIDDALAEVCDVDVDLVTDTRFDHTLRCADEHRRRFALVANTLIHANPQVVDRAVEGVSLLAHSPCSLRRESNVNLEDSRYRAEAVAELFRSELHVRVGDYAAADELLGRLSRAPLREALTAEIALKRGMLATLHGDFEQAHEHLLHALRTATTQNHKSVALQAATELIVVCGVHLSHLEEAQAHATYAEAIAASFAADSATQARLAAHRGRLFIQHGQYPQADAAFERAREHLEGDPTLGLELVDVLVAAADSYSHQHRYDDAQRALEQAQAELHTHLGDRHPRMVAVLTARGRAYRLRNDYERAIHVLHQALDVGRHAFASPPPEFAEIHGLLAGCYYRLERPMAALDAARLAEEYARRFHGAQHPELAQAMARRAVLEHGLERNATALARLDRAWDMLDRTTDHDDPRRAVMMLNTAELHLATGEADVALALVQKARAQEEALHGPEATSVLPYLHTEYRAFTALTDSSSAQATFDRADQLAQHNIRRVLATPSPDPHDVYIAYAHRRKLLRLAPYAESSTDSTVAVLRECLNVLASLSTSREDLLWNLRVALAETLVEAGRCDEADRTLADFRHLPWPHPVLDPMLVERVDSVHSQLRTCEHSPSRDVARPSRHFDRRG